MKGLRRVSLRLGRITLRGTEEESEPNTTCVHADPAFPRFGVKTYKRKLLRLQEVS